MMPRWAAASSWVRSMRMGRTTEWRRPGPHYHTKGLQQQPLAEATSVVKQKHGTGCGDQTSRRDMGQALAVDRVFRSTISEIQGSNLGAILCVAGPALSPLCKAGAA